MMRHPRSGRPGERGTEWIDPVAEGLTNPQIAERMFVTPAP